MIWSVCSEEEMRSFKTTPVFSTYQEALGKNKIKLAVVNDDDKLNFVKQKDTVLLRIASEYLSESLIDTIKKKGCKTTAEEYSVYNLINDKEATCNILTKNSISVPKQYKLNEVEDGHTYFVKPRHGGDSINISEKSICHTAKEVRMRYRSLCVRGVEPVVEDFIDGKEYTVACAKIDDEIITSPIQVECDTEGGVQTFEGKKSINEFCSPVRGMMGFNLQMIAKKVFNVLWLKHHARIDFRSDANGNLYVIDVNAMPGLGMKAHFSKCFLLDRNYSYIDTLRLIVQTATKI